MESKQRLIVYTALTRGYDNLQQPETVSPEIEYICYSNDIPDKQIGAWKVLSIPLQTNSIVTLVRYPKLCPEKILPDCVSSLWVDANITVTNEIQNRALECLAQGVSLALLPHSIRHYVVDEAIMCLRCGFGDPRDIVRQMRFLISENYPDNLGLKECCIIFRRHSDRRIAAFDELWWYIFNKYSKRDQLGCDYALWKTGVPFTMFSDQLLLTRCKRQHVATSKQLSTFKQCVRRFYLMQALYLYMKQRLRTTLRP